MIRISMPPAPSTSAEERRHFERALDHLRCARLQILKAEEEFSAIEGLDLVPIRSEREAIGRSIKTARSIWHRHSGRKPSSRSRRPI